MRAGGANETSAANLMPRTAVSSSALPALIAPWRGGAPAFAALVIEIARGAEAGPVWRRLIFGRLPKETLPPKETPPLLSGDGGAASTPSSPTMPRYAGSVEGAASAASSPRLNLRMAAMNASPSIFCTRGRKSARTLSAVSAAVSAVASCATMGPPSTSSVTKCTVQPVTGAPAAPSTCVAVVGSARRASRASASRAARTWAYTSRSMRPLNDGSSEGCALRRRPLHVRVNEEGMMCMYPMQSTSSTPAPMNMSLIVA